MGKPEEVADMAVYLASDAAKWITGTVVDINGGQVWMTEGGQPNFRDSLPSPLPAKLSGKRKQRGKGSQVPKL
jgi:hypothetical protein